LAMHVMCRARLAESAVCLWWGFQWLYPLLHALGVTVCN